MIVVSEQFERLAKTVMKSRNVPDRIGILIPGNPEFISDRELGVLAQHVLVETLDRLTRQ